MRIKFWGVRGSIAVPGKETINYGGNTSCVEIRSNDNDLIIIDMGTGIRVLGYALLKEFGDCPLQADILITHTHWDHIQGFPFFTPMLQKKNIFRIRGMQYVSHTLEDILRGQMRFEYFPVSLSELSAKIDFHEIIAGKSFSIGKKNNIQINTEILNHPGGALGYRIEDERGKVYVHICDCEQHLEKIDANIIKFAVKADVLVHDSQYTPEEMKNGAKDGWGHSSWETVLKIARLAEVKKLLLFHHEPTHTDEFLKNLESTIKKKSTCEAAIAREDMIIEI